MSDLTAAGDDEGHRELGGIPEGQLTGRGKIREVLNTIKALVRFVMLPVAEHGLGVL